MKVLIKPSMGRRLIELVLSKYHQNLATMGQAGQSRFYHGTRFQQLTFLAAGCAETVAGNCPLRVNYWLGYDASSV